MSAARCSRKSERGALGWQTVHATRVAVPDQGTASDADHSERSHLADDRQRAARGGRVDDPDVVVRDRGVIADPGAVTVRLQRWRDRPLARREQPGWG